MTEKIYTDPHSIVPADLKPGDIIAITVVAVIGQSGRDWAAYEGHISENPVDIAGHGTKISPEVGEALFYAAKAAGLHYRR